MQRPLYPVTRKVEHVDHYHGVAIADPYRWLEDNDSVDTEAWIKAQNTLTTSWLSQIPIRGALRCRFEELLQYPRYYDLVVRDSYLLFRRNDGLQSQLVVYAQHGLDGRPEALIDPIRIQPEGTTRVVAAVPSRDGRYLAYSISRGGTDWEEYFIKDMTTRRDFPETLLWAKISLAAWCGDGFYYSRYPAPSNAAGAFVVRNENHQVWYHRLGTPQSADTLVYEDEKHPLRINIVQSTEDERLIILNVLDLAGGHPGRALWLLDAEAGRHEFAPMIRSLDHDYRFVDYRDNRLIIHTNRNASNWRVVLIDPASPDETHWQELIPEQAQALEVVIAAGGKLFGVYRNGGAHRVCVFDRTGRFENEIPLPGVGTVRVFQGRHRDIDVFWSFTSFTIPMTIYRYNVVTRASTVFHQPELQFDSSEYATKQVFYPSKDGTRIPMFIVHKKELQLTGEHPSLLEGYGGNGMSVGPSFDPLLIALLERGVVYALTCLRGGGEFGEVWHHAGWRERKQNVFDDCIAAAEWLQGNGYTSPHRSALFGISNGGLLVGAVMTQRPELFKVALLGGGVLDMLRFQKFTVGSFWTAEYGSSDDPVMLPVLLAYSPLHNVADGVNYPATLITTSRYDDRVVPAHSYKFAATLQEKGGRASPYLIRIEGTSGHGPVSLLQAIEERADQYAFMLAHTLESRLFGMAAHVSQHECTRE